MNLASGAAPTDPAPRRLRRTWPQRLTIAGAIIAAVGCFAAGSVLFAAQRVVEDRNLITLDSSDRSAGDVVNFETTAPTGADGSGGGNVDPASSEPPGPVETFPLAEPGAKNFLITGADNNSCVDPNSRFAAAFGDRGSIGERSDTIMMWRVNPATSQVAVLSFPRDLYVEVAGLSAKRRINEAYERDQPQRLIDTIRQNFGIETDHFIQVDFCAFKTLVDAVDGVAVPFDRPVRDVSTGLYVAEPGCFTFSGDHALAYVRSRKIQVYQDDGTWSEATGDDRGRISRQQDFIRRTVDSLIDAGAFQPSVVRALIETSDEYLLNDTELTLRKMLEFAGVLRTVDPASITTYQIEARPERIQGASVLVPQIEGSNMQAILQVFQGQATLANAPDQIVTTTSPATTTDTGTDDADTPNTTTPAPGTTAEPTPFTPLPEVEADEVIFGYVPDASVSCRD